MASVLSSDSERMVITKSHYIYMLCLALTTCLSCAHDESLDEADKLFETYRVVDQYWIGLSSHLEGTTADYTLRTRGRAWADDGEEIYSYFIDRTVTGTVGSEISSVRLLGGPGGFDGDGAIRVELDEVTLTFTNDGVQDGQDVNLLVHFLSSGNVSIPWPQDDFWPWEEDRAIANMLQVCSLERFVDFYDGRDVQYEGEAIAMPWNGSIDFNISPYDVQCETVNTDYYAYPVYENRNYEPSTTSPHHALINAVREFAAFFAESNLQELRDVFGIDASEHSLSEMASLLASVDTERPDPSAIEAFMTWLPDIEVFNSEDSYIQNYNGVEHILGGTDDLSVLEVRSISEYEFHGAYDQSDSTIYLNDSLFSNDEALRNVMVQELAHHIDQGLSGDTTGSEGVLAALIVHEDQELSAEHVTLLQSRRDTADVVVDLGSGQRTLSDVELGISKRRWKRIGIGVGIGLGVVALAAVGVALAQPEAFAGIGSLLSFGATTGEVAAETELTVVGEVLPNIAVDTAAATEPGAVAVPWVGSELPEAIPLGTAAADGTLAVATPVAEGATEEGVIWAGVATAAP